MIDGFAVLMSIYWKEKEEWLEQSFQSIISQSLLPNQIVIVEDGPLTDGLYTVIDKFESSFSKLKIEVTRVKFSKNMGLAFALNEGLRHCKYSYVARMDSDDISLQNRFEKQMTFLQKHPEIDVLGGQIAEFDETMTKFLGMRIVPTSHEEIIKFAKKRSPMNHMTVVYKKESVLKVGAYGSLTRIEDYHLWVRMITAGMKFANLPDCLVKVRTGKSFLDRRRGYEYLKNEIKLLSEFRRMRFLSMQEYLQGVFARSMIRIMPRSIVHLVYRKFLRKGGEPYFAEETDCNLRCF